MLLERETKQTSPDCFSPYLEGREVVAILFPPSHRLSHQLRLKIRRLHSRMARPNSVRSQPNSQSMQGEKDRMLDVSEMKQKEKDTHHELDTRLVEDVLLPATVELCKGLSSSSPFHVASMASQTQQQLLRWSPLRICKIGQVLPIPARERRRS